MKSLSASDRRQQVLSGNVGRTLFDLALPSLVGIASVILFSVVDAYYVGQLGARQLAAMSYTFPVAFLVMSISMGLGVGTTSAVARAIGEGDLLRVRRLTTDSLLLVNALVILFALLGLWSIDPMFRALGASEDLLPLIRDYMVPWYLGVGLLVIPMVGNAALRATGDTRTPSMVMLVAGVANAALAPLLVFGPGPFPRWEMRGAAVATAMSWGITFIAAVYCLHYRERMLDFRPPPLRLVIQSWKQILFVGLPATATGMLVPLSAAIITRMVSAYGESAVGAYGVISRLQSLATIGISALSISLTPFIGQNHGAGLVSRVRGGLIFSMKASVLWGIGCALPLALLAHPIAQVFSQDPQLVDYVTTFLHFVPFTFGLAGLTVMAGSLYNALNQPLRASLLAGIHMFLLIIPLSWLFSRWLGMTGIFLGGAVANVVGGAVALFLSRSHLLGRTSSPVPQVAYEPVS